MRKPYENLRNNLLLREQFHHLRYVQIPDPAISSILQAGHQIESGRVRNTVTGYGGFELIGVGRRCTLAVPTEVGAFHRYLVDIGIRPTFRRNASIQVTRYGGVNFGSHKFRKPMQTEISDGRANHTIAYIRRTEEDVRELYAAIRFFFTYVHHNQTMLLAMIDRYSDRIMVTEDGNSSYTTNVPTQLHCIDVRSIDRPVGLAPRSQIGRGHWILDDTYYPHQDV